MTVTERIEVQWVLSPSATLDDVNDRRDQLAAADPASAASVVASDGILPVIGWILGAFLVVKLAEQVAHVACRIRKSGVLIDASGPGPVRVSELPDIPGGRVIIIDRTGCADERDVCKVDVDLTALISAAVGG